MVVECIEINRTFVEIFKLLGKHEETTTKFNKLSIVFGTLVLNEKLLFNFCNDYLNNKDTIENFTFFKNTDFENIYKIKLNDEEKQILQDKLKFIYDKAQEHLMQKNTENKKNTIDETINMILKNDKFKKMMGINNISAKKLKKLLETNPKLQEMIKNIEKCSDDPNLKNVFFNLFKNDDVFESITKFASTNIFKNLAETLQKQDNNDIFKKIYLKIKNEHPEIVEEINKVIEMFDFEKLQKIYIDLLSKIEKIDFTNISSVMEFFTNFIAEDKTIQGTMWKFHMTLESGLVNIDNIKNLLKKIIQIALKEFNLNEFIGKNEYNTLINLIYNKHRKNPVQRRKTKNERKQKRIKSYRRKRKKELNRKYNRRNKKNKK